MKRWTRSDLSQSFLSVIIGFVSMADVILFIVWRLGPRINAIWIATLFLAIGNGEIALFRPRLLLAYARNKKAFTSTEIRVTAIAHFAVAGLIGFGGRLTAHTAIGILLLVLSTSAFTSVCIHWRGQPIKVSVVHISLALFDIFIGIVLILDTSASVTGVIFSAGGGTLAVLSAFFREQRKEGQLGRDANTEPKEALSPLEWGLPPSHPRKHTRHFGT